MQWGIAPTTAMGQRPDAWIYACDFAVGAHTGTPTPPGVLGGRSARPNRTIWPEFGNACPVCHELNLHAIYAQCGCIVACGSWIYSSVEANRAEIPRESELGRYICVVPVYIYPSIDTEFATGRSNRVLVNLGEVKGITVPPVAKGSTVRNPLPTPR